MTNERWHEAMKTGILTQQELEEGFHFCSEWDQDLVGPEENCGCGFNYKEE